MRKNIRQKFSIRKFTIGTGSILLGLTFMIGLGTSAQAAEEVETSKIQEVVTTISSEDTSTSEVNDENATNTEDSTLELEKQISSEELADELIEKPEITSDSTEEVETDRALEGLVENPIVEEEVIEEVVKDESTETEVEESYIQTKYPEQEYKETPVDVGDKRDKDQSGKLEYFDEKNGYVSTQERTVEEGVQTCENCTADKVTTKYTNKVDLNAESVMDPNLDDYSNNGYIVKVRNPNNHPNATDGFGPGNLEVQHWQDSNVSTGTITQYWRIVFASDYAIDNTVMRVSLPYNTEGIQTTDVSSWVANRYYPAVTNNTSKYTEIITPSDIVFDGNDAILNFGNISANSVFGMMFTKSFTTPENPNDAILNTSVNVSGEWNEADLIRQLNEKKEQMRADGFTEEEIENAQLDYINSSLTPEQVEYINEVCVIPEDPTDPTDPVDPEDPTDPTDPVDPEDPTDPTDPVDPEDPTEPTDPVDPEEPTDPVDPEEPTDPVDPEEPTDPVDPEEPEEPTDPVDPEEPTDPVDPVDPEDPTDPVDPENPTDPTDPVDPEDPTDPTDPVDPEDPTDPVDPIDIEKPSVQDVIEQPSGPVKSEQPSISNKSVEDVESESVNNSTSSNVVETSKETLPNTGESENKSLTIIGTILAMLGAVLVFNRRKKEN